MEVGRRGERGMVRGEGGGMMETRSGLEDVGLERTTERKLDA